MWLSHVMCNVMEIVPKCLSGKRLRLAKIIQSKVFHDLTLGFGKLEVID